ncbi:hypothetical protein GGF32_004441 [Allomyces javanicus]|nr:hypothetical protein GGF32_004441 [Allomyces javanicus]
MPHDPIGTSLLHTLVAAPLAPPNMVLVRNLLQVSTHLGEVVRAAGGTPVAVPGGTQWHRDVLAGHSMWPRRFETAFAMIGKPVYVTVDEMRNEVRFWMRRSPRYFGPVNAHDMPATRPPSRSVFVVLNMPPFEDLVPLLCDLTLKSVVVDHVGTPATIDMSMRYGFLSLPVRHAGYAENLDRVWVRGAQLRLYELHDARALFADPDQLMATIMGFAKTVREEEKEKQTGANGSMSR